MIFLIIKKIEIKLQMKLLKSRIKASTKLIKKLNSNFRRIFKKNSIRIIVQKKILLWVKKKMI